MGLIVALGLAATACTQSGTDQVRQASPADGQPPEGVPHVARGWKTDWSKRTIDLSELVVGIPRDDPRDVIPPIDSPTFESVASAAEWLVDREPVVVLELSGEAKAYPLRILTWHEVVNDDLGGETVVVTYCPLCNSAVAFRRAVDGRALTFGTSGLLRSSDLVMWDRQTESLWQQITGEAVVGEMAGKRLEFVPVSLVRWQEFRQGHPDGKVLSRQTGFERSYGTNPYAFYDSADQSPFLFTGELDDRYPPMERVVGVTVGEVNKAYPFSVIAEERAVNDTVGGVPVLVVWGGEDAASALDDPTISEGRAVGVGLAYERTLDSGLLTFEPAGPDAFTDRETGSTWDLLGRAVAGPLAGRGLAPAVHANHFWFAWAAFNPDAEVYVGKSVGTPDY